MDKHQYNYERFSSIISQYVFSKNISGTLYGEAQLLQNKSSNQQLIHIAKIYNRQDYAIRLAAQAFDKCQIKDNILLLIAYKVSEIKELCGNFYKLQLLYEYYPSTLNDKINLSNQFTESQLKDILYNLLISLKTLYSNNQPHQFIQPKHIILKNNKYILSDIKFMTQISEFQSLITNPQQQCYLSPEQYTELCKRTKDPKFDNEKCDIFSIGLVILQCMIRTYPDIYNFNTQNLNNIKLTNYILEARLKYPGIIQLLNPLLEQDPKNRPNIDQVLLSFDQLKSIENLKPLKSISPFRSEQYSTTPVTPIRSRITKFMPVTHQNHDVVQLYEEGQLSQVRWEKDTNSTLKTEDNPFDSYNYTHRPQKTPDRQTRPCKSPFRSTQSIPLKNYYTSNLPSQRSIQTISSISYDFADGIKLDPPSSMISLNYK